MEERLTALVDKLRSNGHRLTPQRMAILGLLVTSKGHPTVEQVYEQVKVDFPMTSLATVYKTVTLLKDVGEILELGFAGESSRYDGAKPYPHPHLVCIQCDNIIDPELNEFDEISHELAQKYGFRILNHRVDFYGICPDCQEQTSAPQTRG
jgi:Fur family transcriptional regulator, peroxide stress response regulator